MDYSSPGEASSDELVDEDDGSISLKLQTLIHEPKTVNNI